MIVVRDLNGGGMSVTNDAESVVAEVFRKHGNHPIVYQDSGGNFDQLVHVAGEFQGFKFLNTKSESDAITLTNQTPANPIPERR